MGIYANETILSQTIYDAIVGSASDVSAGFANYTSIQAAHDALSAGAKIYVLSRTITESLTISKIITIEGKSRSSQLTGNLIIQSGGAYSLIRSIRFVGNITLNASANSILIRDCWQATGYSITNNGTGNSILVAQE